MKSKRYIISKETRARCRIFQVTGSDLSKFQSISLELFHYMLDVKSIDFEIYFRVDDEMIERNYSACGKVSLDFQDVIAKATTGF